jgi:hypothetical protein
MIKLCTRFPVPSADEMAIVANHSDHDTGEAD